jgi:hypothetical protein
MSQSLLSLFTAALLIGCNIGKTSIGSTADDTGSDEEGAGIDKDARLIADVFTWPCSNGTSLYPGVFAHLITMEYAPDGLRSLELPAAGECTYGLDMFPSNAGEAAADLTSILGTPSWTNDNYSGNLDMMSTGFWTDDVLEDTHSCEEVDQRQQGGTAIEQAGVLSGAATPEPAEMPFVEYDGFDSLLEWGDEAMASWDDDHEWSQVWVQIRREVDGEAWESVTCNATGAADFVIDDAIWELFDEELSVDRNNIYIAFQNASTVETDSGLKIDVLTRSIDIAVVTD